MSRAGVSLSLVLLLAPTAWGQSGNPDPLPPTLTGIFPPAANPGETTWSLSGRNLKQARTLSISGAGVEVRRLDVKNDNEAIATVSVSSGAAPGIREVRLDGPTGTSNLLLVQVESLNLSREKEPNDKPENAAELSPGLAVVGILKPQDLDVYRIKGTPKARVTIDLVARRLGTAISPVLTLTDSHGRSIRQARETPGIERDARVSVTLPDDGILHAEIRDNLYGGSDRSAYLLRIDPAPFATGLYPLAIPAGKASQVTVAGGSLELPVSRTIQAPDTPGAWFDPGPFGEVAAPGRLLIGSASDVTEAGKDDDGVSSTILSQGMALDGRIAQADEVDRYRFAAKAGQRVRFQVQAARLGSWLDSVLTIRDSKGEVVAENDDLGEGANVRRAQGVNNQGLQELPPDSVVDFTPPADGAYIVEITDRYGSGGPEYAYRLTVGQPRPDFRVTLLLGNPTAGQQVAGLRQNANVRLPLGAMGVFNLRPGAIVPVDFLVTSEGRPGPVEIRVEGLPEGVTADPVTIKFSGGSSNPSTPLDPVGDRIVLKVARFADPGLSEFRVVATAKPPGVASIIHAAEAVIGLDPTSLAGGARPVTRTIDRFSLRIKGEPRRAFVGPPGPPVLQPIQVPGPVLQGDTLNLSLRFEPPVDDPEKVQLKAAAKGVGLATFTVVSTDVSRSEDEGNSEFQVRVLASTKAPAGPGTVDIEVRQTRGPATKRTVPVEVRVPVELVPPTAPQGIAPGKEIGIKVTIKRQPGCEAEVELRAEKLPPGIKQVGEATIEPEMNSATVRLAMSANAEPLTKDTAFQIGAVVHMPRGRVPVVSAIRPILRRIAADEKGESGSNNRPGPDVQP